MAMPYYTQVLRRVCENVPESDISAQQLKGTVDKMIGLLCSFACLLLFD